MDMSLSTLLSDLRQDSLAAIAGLDTSDALVDYRNAILGKSGKLTDILK